MKMKFIAFRYSSLETKMNGYGVT